MQVNLRLCSTAASKTNCDLPSSSFLDKLSNADVTISLVKVIKLLAVRRKSRWGNYACRAELSKSMLIYSHAPETCMKTRGQPLYIPDCVYWMGGRGQSKEFPVYIYWPYTWRLICMVNISLYYIHSSAMAQHDTRPSSVQTKST